MAKKDDDRASRPDDENPEWTAADFKKARPALTVFAETFGPEAAEAIKNRGGRPVKADKKVSQTLRLDPDVLVSYKQLGRGWQTPMNAVLREHAPSNQK
jgi:uncharacterized protein (DUF4415 family)